MSKLQRASCKCRRNLRLKIFKEHKMWRKLLRLGLIALAALNPPALLLAQNPARGIKFERLGLEQGLSQNTVMNPARND